MKVIFGPDQRPEDKGDKRKLEPLTPESAALFSPQSGKDGYRNAAAEQKRACRYNKNTCH